MSSTRLSSNFHTLREDRDGRRWPRQDSLDRMITMSKSAALRLSIPGLLFGLFATTLASTASSAPVTNQFDGNYRGTFTLTATPTRFMGGGGCEESKIEQVMSISGNQVYLDRKSAFSGAPLLLSGTISADGSVTAAGVTPDQKSPGLSVFFALTGKIENNEFTGQLGNRSCNYRVQMKR